MSEDSDEAETLRDSPVLYQTPIVTDDSVEEGKVVFDERIPERVVSLYRCSKCGKKTAARYDASYEDVQCQACAGGGHMVHVKNITSSEAQEMGFDE